MKNALRLLERLSKLQEQLNLKWTCEVDGEDAEVVSFACTAGLPTEFRAVVLYEGKQMAIDATYYPVHGIGTDVIKLNGQDVLFDDVDVEVHAGFPKLGVEVAFQFGFPGSEVADYEVRLSTKVSILQLL